MKETQTEQVLDYLRAHGSISSLEAFTELHCHRLAARVKEIRSRFGEASVVTETERHEGGTHARYRTGPEFPMQVEMFA
jgi:Helix-turn-helix domain